MPSDRLRVFVSSSYAELAEERAVVARTLREFGFDPLMVEDYLASATSFAEAYRKDLAHADLVISLFWKKLGRYTLDEFEEAQRRRVPLLVFVKGRDAERDAELREFIERIDDPTSGLGIGFYETPAELRTSLVRGLALIGRRSDKIGGVEAGDFAPQAMRSLRFTSSGEAIESWDTVMDLARDKWRGRNWVFRGQADSQWGLSTALERTAMKFGVDWADVRRLEDDLLVRFKRQLHHFRAVTPEDDSRIEWLALMQHHGAPTRLMDWSYSFYVALLFALEHAVIGTPCAIWALDANWCRDLALRSLGDEVRESIAADRSLKSPATVDSILFRDDPVPLVFPVSPFRLNERLVLQQGIFVAPADVGMTFQENLDLCAHRHGESLELEKTEIVCTPELLKDAVRELHRMNVNRATLFPGLDGFSAHLANLAVDRELIAMDVTGGPDGRPGATRPP